MIFAVLATGPSMSQAVADSVRKYRTIVVNNAYELAPWADALAAQDVQWWREHRKALEFAGRKFSANVIPGVEHVSGMDTQTNSGALGIYVARMLGASRILLFGFDGHGTHYFGKHPEHLVTTTEARRGIFQQQMLEHNDRCKRVGVEVINCTPGSALRAFPFAWD